MSSIVAILLAQLWMFLDDATLSESIFIAIAVIIPALFILCVAGVFILACCIVCRCLKRNKQRLRGKEGDTELR